MKEFAFDVTLQVVVRVRTTTRGKAVEMMECSMDAMVINKTVAPGITITEASLHGDPEFFSVTENGIEKIWGYYVEE